jgi:hypothetical protein
VTAQWKRSLWITGAILGALALFYGGVRLGVYAEQQRFELAKSFSVVKADEYLANDKPEQALSALHFAKAYESLRGDTDGLLAKAYLADGEPCLALAIAESHLRYMDRNKLTPLAGYAKSQELRERASVACNDTREAQRSHATDGKQ